VFYNDPIELPSESNLPTLVTPVIENVPEIVTTISENRVIRDFRPGYI